MSNTPGVQSYNLNLNKVYFFSFHSDINKLNGLYTVQAIFKYDEIEALLEDPIQYLYVAVNKVDLYDEQELYKKYRYEVFYKLQKVDEEGTTYFVPDSLIVAPPSEDFLEVLEYMCMIQVGILDEPTELDALLVEISKMTRKYLGITPAVSSAVYNKKYIAKTTLKDFIHSRNIVKQSTSYDRTIKELEKENEKLRTKITEYETIIIEYEKYKEKIKGLFISR